MLRPGFGRIAVAIVQVQCRDLQPVSLSPSIAWYWKAVAASASISGSQHRLPGTPEEGSGEAGFGLQERTHWQLRRGGTTEPAAAVPPDD